MGPSGGIAHAGSLEQGFDFGGTLLPASHVRGQAGLEAGFVPGRAAARHGLLEIVVQEFVGIAIRCVWRQVEQFDLVLVGLDPGGDDPGAVDT